jgi:hypothetical protein
LEHLGILLSYWDDNHIMEIQNLVALHQFQQLSSLEIVIEFGNYNDFYSTRHFIAAISSPPFHRRRFIAKIFHRRAISSPIFFLDVINFTKKIS